MKANEAVCSLNYVQCDALYDTTHGDRLVKLAWQKMLRNATDGRPLANYVTIRTSTKEQTPPHHILLSISIRKSTSPLRYIRPCFDLQTSPISPPPKKKFYCLCIHFHRSLVLLFDSGPLTRFSVFLYVKNGPASHPASCSTSTPLAKVVGAREVDHPPSISRSRMGGAIGLLHIYAPWRAYRWNVNFTLSPPPLSALSSI